VSPDQGNYGIQTPSKNSGKSGTKLVYTYITILSLYQVRGVNTQIALLLYIMNTLSALI